MLTLIEAIIFIIILILTIYGFFQPLYLRYRLIRLGLPEKRFDHPWKRMKDAFFSFFFLRCSLKKERVFTGLIHFFILYGSLTFDTVSVYHIIEGFNKNIHPNIWHSLIADIFAAMVLIAVLFFIIRRYLVRPKSYTYPSVESAIIYTLLITVTLTFLLYEGAVIAQRPDQASLAFMGKAFASWLPSSETVVRIFWWIHILNVFIFVIYVPRSKYLHMIFGPINIAFQNYDPTSKISPLDLENSESFGVVKLSDLSWKDLFDGFACVDCGRCDDYCPANQSGKPLSPKNIIIHLKDTLLKEGKAFLKGKKQDLPALMNNIYTSDEIWTCTTCGACMYVCPVLNEHLPKILGLRQSQALMEAKFPGELNQFFKNMETNSNPWGFGSSTRSDWAQDLDVKYVHQDNEIDILYWIGCAGSFDDRK